MTETTSNEYLGSGSGFDLARTIKRLILDDSLNGSFILCAKSTTKYVREKKEGERKRERKNWLFREN